VQLGQKDWVLLAIAVFSAAVAVFQGNTYLSVMFLVVTGAIISYLVWLHADIHKGYRGLLVSLIALSVLGGSYYISNDNFEKEMRRNYGRIYPSNIATSPQKKCGPGDDIVLYPGQNSFQISSFPYTFLTIDGRPVISLGRDGDAISIDTLWLEDEKGNIIAHVNKDEFWIDPTVERFMVPDRSKLAIADHSGKVALLLWFMNKNHLFVDGNFHYHGFTVSIGNSGIFTTLADGKTLGGGLNDDCFYDHQIYVDAMGLTANSKQKGATDLKITP
jgi:hypothetical protein